MVVYTATKRDFNNDVIMNLISDKVLLKLREHGIAGGEEAEYNSWQNSLGFMRNIIDDKDIPDEVTIAIEYQIPLTSKRVDFMIAGADGSGCDNIIVVELKQWKKAEKVDDLMQHSVRTFTGRAYRIVSHPSYQAYSYAAFIRNSLEQVQDANIGIIPCAYLHNYSPEYADQLKCGIYEPWYKEAPFFIKDQVTELRNFIKKYVSKKSNWDNPLNKIENGRIKPSKSLQDSLVSLLKGNREFILLDDQIVVYDMCRKIMDQCRKDMKKRTIIIQGGPGTGKSVLAINLLCAFTSKGLNASYCTKNSAPRAAYLSLLGKSDLKKAVNIKQLFRSPFKLCQVATNSYDCLIVDEAHRLVKQMYGDFQGENQIKECINASLFTIFLLDEDQQITTKDIGCVDGIECWAKELNSQVIMNDDTKLVSQFRCNGSDQYIQLINNILQIGESVDIDFSEINYDIKVFDDPCEMRDELRVKNGLNNKARMVAGYCYDWNVKNNRGNYDIALNNDFYAKWNLADDKIWAINSDSFEEVGCIHTAQGLEFDYTGVLVGRDLSFDSTSGEIHTNKSQISKDDKTSGIRNASEEVAARLIKNTYKTLLTRGQKGCYIYCEDKNLSNHIKQMIRGM